jgi:hypothetical protein
MHFHTEQRRGLPRTIAAALVLILVAVLLSTACQTTRQLTDAGSGATLELDNDWEKIDDEREGTVFRARRLEPDLELRVETLSSPLRLSAAPVWTRAWLSERYDAVEADESTDVRVSGYPAVRFGVSATERGLSFEYVAVNAGGTTYLLTVWSDRDAFEAWEGSVDALAGGLRLPDSTGTDSLACREQTKSVSSMGLTIDLPAESTDGAQICDVWNTRGDRERVTWSLDSRLLTGFARSEALPYAIGPEEYRDIFIERMAPEQERTKMLDDVELGRVIRIRRETDSIEMTDTYVFITRDERAWLVQLSTPTALMDDNRAVIDAIIDSLRLTATD